jgi:hypothetical protein
MDIEQQRWAPVAAQCAPDLNIAEMGSNGWSKARRGAVGWIMGIPPVNTPYSQWQDWLELGEKMLFFDYEKWFTGASPMAGCYLAKSCTQYATYPRAWTTFLAFSGQEVLSKLNAAFDGKGVRIIDLDLRGGFPQSPNPDWPDGVYVTAVANYGAAAKAWWWSGFAGATGAQVADVLNGKAWPAGGFKQDNVKKRLVAIERSRVDGRFRFVLNEAKPGEAWWWGYGASIANITSVLKGEAWADFKADGIEKRLVSYRRHAGDNWTFLMVPRNGLGWWWFPKIEFDDLVAAAQKHGARIIHLDQWGIASGEDFSSFSAILVQNA